MILVCSVLKLYLLVLIVRAILSWFPLSPGSALAPIASFLFKVTEPVLAPVRRIIPPLGGFDISFIVVLVVLEIVIGRLPCGGAFL